jgi:hypothetical protein
VYRLYESLSSVCFAVLCCQLTACCAVLNDN